MEVTKADIVVKLRALRMALFDAADESGCVPSWPRRAGRGLDPQGVLSC